MTKREKVKFYIALLILIPAAIFVARSDIASYKTTGCVVFFQKARPHFEKMPRGVSFTDDELEYTCSLDKKKIGISLLTTLIIAGWALHKWKKLRPRKENAMQDPTAPPSESGAESASPAKPVD